MRRILLAVGAAALALLLGFYALNAYIYAEKQGDPADIRPYRASLAGEVVCLPHADTSGPTTLECAIGLRTEAGEYYALDFALMSQEHPGFDTGDRFSAAGLVIPAEALGDDPRLKYAIEGVFSVTDSVQEL